MRRFIQRILLVGTVAVPLAACGSTGGLSKVDTDPALVTGSVTPGQVAEMSQTSDANTIRNAISAISLDNPGALPLAWANRDTGSRGTISQVHESDKDGVVCRTFETSRESYEGVSLYAGQSCLGADGQWFMQEFAAI